MMLTKSIIRTYDIGFNLFDLNDTAFGCTTSSILRVDCISTLFYFAHHNSLKCIPICLTIFFFNLWQFLATFVSTANASTRFKPAVTIQTCSAVKISYINCFWQSSYRVTCTCWIQARCFLEDFMCRVQLQYPIRQNVMIGLR